MGREPISSLDIKVSGDTAQRSVLEGSPAWTAGLSYFV
jgi:hypothetical protein